MGKLRHKLFSYPFSDLATYIRSHGSVHAKFYPISDKMLKFSDQIGSNALGWDIPGAPPPPPSHAPIIGILRMKKRTHSGGWRRGIIKKISPKGSIIFIRIHSHSDLPPPRFHFPPYEITGKSGSVNSTPFQLF